jgi:hypothetical protein
MKKIIVTIAIAFCGVFLSAQNVFLGGKAGLSSSSFRGEGFQSESFRNSYQVGMFLGISPAEWFVVQPEFMYDRRGSERINILGTSQTVRVNYFNMPVAAKFRIPIQNVFYPNFQVGPYWSTRLSERVTYSNDVGIIETHRVETRKTDFGGFVGGGADIQLNPIFLTFDVRYYFGAIDANRSNNSVTMRNSQIGLNAGIGFIF